MYNTNYIYIGILNHGSDSWGPRIHILGTPNFKTTPGVGRLEVFGARTGSTSSLAGWAASAEKLAVRIQWWPEKWQLSVGHRGMEW